MPIDDVLSNAFGSMLEEQRWVAWENVNGRKVPRYFGGNAKSNDPTTWMSYEEASRCAAENGYDGVGLMLSDGYLGVDLDNCVHDGEIEPWAQRIIDDMGSYAEISPSGEGVHIVAYADPQDVGAIGRSNRTKGIEIYNHGRYVTVTGKNVNDLPVTESSAGVEKVLADNFSGPSPEDRVANDVAQLARDETRRRANETMIHNVQRDSHVGVRYARVPMGDSCEFCIMLASRGFVYHTKKTAGEFNHFHSDCRCKVVPGFPEIEFYVKNNTVVSRARGPSVEGYDPDEYKRQWDIIQDVDAIEDDSFRPSQRAAAKKAIINGMDFDEAIAKAKANEI